ncbi:hypothetical protein Btru_070384 [Bulinus truncatus]|nr:hypothetical protein Btru_070384 [Bulinus truncatus]
MEDIDGGEIENKGTFPMTHTFEVSRSVEETITHSSTSSWMNSHQLAGSWFGPNNNLRCHCTTGCNSEGFCVNNGKCISGWFGIKCQYQNIANNGTFNPPQYSSILNDGDNTTCIDDSSFQSLEVKWDTSYPFTWMRLVVIGQCEHVKPLVGVSPEQGELCVLSTTGRIGELSIVLHVPGHDQG